MKNLLSPVVLMAALASAIGANAPTPGPSQPPIVPGSLSGSSAQSPAPASGGLSPAPAVSGGTSPSSPAPGPSSKAPGRFHLHRPGTDVEGDSLTGNAASDLYIFRGNVILHSDPKIDREFSSATESDAPIEVTADEIDTDRVGMTYVAKGHVHFVQGDRSGRADLAMLDEQKHNLDLLGNADVLEGEHRARAAKMHYNLADRQFRGSGDVRIYQPVPTPGPRASATAAPKRKRHLPF